VKLHYTRFKLTLQLVKTEVGSQEWQLSAVVQSEPNSMTIYPASSMATVPDSYTSAFNNTSLPLYMRSAVGVFTPAKVTVPPKAV
jgi:hypothetical protein